MSKHTPGPWLFQIDAHSRVSIISTATGERICSWPGILTTETLPNAVLMAAAPLMFEALLDCVSVMQRDLNGLAVIQPELRQAERAISAARGE